jgi:hypothetical protein
VPRRGRVGGTESAAGNSAPGYGLRSGYAAVSRANPDCTAGVRSDHTHDSIAANLTRPLVIVEVSPVIENVAWVPPLQLPPWS